MNEAFLNGSGYGRGSVILAKQRYRVTLVQNLLTSLADDVMAIHRALGLQDGPAIPTGRSWDGPIITEASNYLNVAALAYIATFQPDSNQTI